MTQDHLHQEIASSLNGRDLDKANGLAEEYRNEYPEDSLGYYMRAQCAILWQDGTSVVRLFREALERNTLHVTQLRDACHVFKKLGLNFDAADCYEKPLRIEPSNSFISELFSQLCLTETSWRK